MNLSDLHPLNPYAKFPLADYEYRSFTQWGSEDTNFNALMNVVRPELIIEVGSWYGGSAIHMGTIGKSATYQCPKIVCVDTFLGALEMWTDQSDATRYGALMMKHGRPDFYMQFLANVLHNHLEDVIIPFPQTSMIAAKWFATKGIRADMIYIDGSHAYDDVLDDLRAYWPLVRPGGVMFGDDWETFREVNDALGEFLLWVNINTDVELNVKYTARQWEIWK